jgi:phosphoribosyl 1,2-cyclic phosphodiesterase
VAHDDDAVPALILDAGTGLREVTPLLGGKPFCGTILLTHLHWDHTHGLPFFAGGDRQDAAVSLLLPDQQDGASAEAVLARAMSPPHFPIGPSGLRGDWSFGLIGPGRYEADGFSVEALEVPHKGGRTLGYRISDGRTALTYIPDHCPTVLGPGPEGWGEYHRAALSLAAGADAVLHDAFAMPEELAAGAAFGHAVADYAAGLAVRAGAALAVLVHHRPDRTDADLDRLAARLAASAVPVIVGAQQQVLEL